MRQHLIVIIVILAHFLLIAGAYEALGIGGACSAFGLVILLWLLANKMKSLGDMLRQIKRDMPI